MKPDSGWFRRQATRVVALILLTALYGFTRLPGLADAERARLAARFAFTAAPAAGAQPGCRSTACARSAPACGTSRPGSRASARRWRSTTSTATACPTTSARSTRASDRAIVAPVPGTGAALRGLRARAGAAAVRRRDHGARWAACPATSTRTARTDLLVYYWGRTPVALPAARRARPAGPPGQSRLPGRSSWCRAASAGTPTPPPGRPRRRRPRRPRHRQLLPGRRPHPRRARRRPRADAGLRCPGRPTAGGTACCSGQAPGPAAEPAVRFADGSTALRPTRSPAAGRWRSAPPTSTATCCPRSTSPTTSGPTGCCTTARRPGQLRFALLRGRKGFTSPLVQGAGPRLLQGHGRRLRRPQRRRLARHLRQQHRHRVRPGGEPLRSS